MSAFWIVDNSEIRDFFANFGRQTNPMSEKDLTIEIYDPVELFGANDQYLEILRKHFPKLKIIARGDVIRLIGDDEEIRHFEDKLNVLLSYLSQYGHLTEGVVLDLLKSNEEYGAGETRNGDDVLVYGKNGMLIKARSPNQSRMVESCGANDLTIAVGPAGTGKTYTAVALAVRALKNKEVKRIILTRPAVEAGENLGFLPGDLKDKLDPYLQPLYDALWDMIPSQKLTQYIEDRVIEIAPLAFMRGRTLDNAFVILDEAQNTTIGQMKMFLTRMGRSAKFIVTGDITQIDLPGKQTSGLVHAMDVLKNIPGIEFIYLDHQDIIRHKLVTRILNAYNEKGEK